MRDDLFADLLESAEEMVAIEKGLKQPNAEHIHTYSTVDVRAIREAAGKSRQEMAEILCVSYDSITSWETRRRNPSGLTKKVLTMIERNPRMVIEQLESVKV